MVTEYYGPPECGAMSFTVWIVTEYYEGSVYVKRFCGPVYVLADLSYISQPLVNKRVTGERTVVAGQALGC